MKTMKTFILNVWSSFFFEVIPFTSFPSIQVDPNSPPAHFQEDVFGPKSVSGRVHPGFQLGRVNKKFRESFELSDPSPTNLLGNDGMAMVTKKSGWMGWGSIFLIIYNIVTYHLVKSLRPHWSFLGSPKVAFLEGKWDPGYFRWNLGWWKIMIWPDCMETCKGSLVKSILVSIQDFWGVGKMFWEFTEICGWPRNLIELQTTFFGWMFGETTVFHVNIWFIIQLKEALKTGSISGSRYISHVFPISFPRILTFFFLTSNGTSLRRGEGWLIDWYFQDISRHFPPQTWKLTRLETFPLDSSRYLQGDVLANATRPGWAVGGERYSNPGWGTPRAPTKNRAGF